MKRLIALILAGLMALGGACLAAEWPEGCSPSQPYSHLPEVNLSQTMGYIMLFPRAKLPTTRFCNALHIYLPRQDVAAGEGLLHLYEKAVDGGEAAEVCFVDFANADSICIRPLTEKELQNLMWGEGRCIEVFLPRSLEFGDKGHDYYVLMDEGCFTAADGALKSLQITSDEAWVPVIQGDYGISGLYYLDAPPAGEGQEASAEEEPEEEVIEYQDYEEQSEATPEATETPEPTEAPTQTPEPTSAPEETPADPSEYVVRPDTGDKLYFDLVIGGDAKLAVVYSENGSVAFDGIEYDQSGPVRGTVVDDEVQWGIAFYDENDNIFDMFTFGGE